MSVTFEQLYIAKHDLIELKCEIGRADYETKKAASLLKKLEQELADKETAFEKMLAEFRQVQESAKEAKSAS